MTLDELLEAEWLRRSLNSITEAMKDGEKYEQPSSVTLLVWTDDSDETTIMCDIVAHLDEFTAYLRHLQEKRKAALRELGVDIG